MAPCFEFKRLAGPARAAPRSSPGTSKGRRRRVAPVSRRESDLFDLREVELDRGRPAEDRDGDADLRLVVVDVLDRAVEIGERAFLDADHLADFPLHLWARLLDAFLHLRDD